jgi:hypothetical protein
MFKLRILIVLSCLLLLVIMPAQAQEQRPTVSLGSSEALGPVLVGPNGMTLYISLPIRLTKVYVTNAAPNCGTH